MLFIAQKLGVVHNGAPKIEATQTNNIFVSCMEDLKKLVLSEKIKSQQPGASTYTGIWQGQAVLAKIVLFDNMPAQDKLQHQFEIMSSKLWYG